MPSLEADEGIELGRTGPVDPVGVGDSRRARAERARSEAKRSSASDEDDARGARGGGNSSDEDDAPGAAAARAKAARDGATDTADADPGSGGIGGGATESPSGDATEPLIESALEASTRDARTLVRPGAALGAPDVATAMGVLVLGGISIAFTQLCALDGQCLAADADPGVLGESYVPRGGALAALAALAFVGAPAVMLGADAVRRQTFLRARDVTGDTLEPRQARDRRLVFGAMLLAACISLLLCAVAIERGQYRLRGASFGDSARRQWAACEALALPSGVWRRRGDCAYDNSVRVAYKRASNLAQRRVSNLRHVVWVAIAGSVAFFIATFALALSLSSLALPLPCFNPDIIRRKRRLIERPR